jgi:hypothetical protein
MPLAFNKQLVMKYLRHLTKTGKNYREAQVIVLGELENLRYTLDSDKVKLLIEWFKGIYNGLQK